MKVARVNGYRLRYIPWIEEWRVAVSLKPAQSRAARGLLDWPQTRLAELSNLSESTIRDFEKGRRVPSTNNLAAMIAAFTSAGVELIQENGGGVGVRLKDVAPA